MRKLLILLAVLLLIGSTAATAIEQTPGATSPAEITQPATAPATGLCESMKVRGASQTQLAQQGCCSWHNGVCGCQIGRIVCCDGSYSPSCRC